MKAQKSKTMWFSLALVIFGALLDNLTYVKDNIPSDYYGFIFIGIGIIVAILRFITTEPIQR
ncbi:hypothetical protein UFOVP42_29 [uncultured Caudovirales phage]|uniref:Uncharacterized protein n=1 Tax=uncultured Caudovirales phage TaxID=2100421 RepID=A0A6J5KPZ2_9CAUD|nr:hypothetical protein UFOVP42_29 [uncultured Caudovirales phage]